MAMRYQAGTRVSGWNMSEGEEKLFVALLEEIRSKVPASERWLSELDATFYTQGLGVLEPVLDEVNRHARRMHQDPLLLQETEKTEYMQVRGADRALLRRNMRDRAKTFQGRESLRDEGHDAMAMLVVLETPWQPESQERERIVPRVAPPPVPLKDSRPMRRIEAPVNFGDGPQPDVTYPLPTEEPKQTAAPTADVRQGPQPEPHAVPQPNAQQPVAQSGGMSPAAPETAAPVQGPVSMSASPLEEASVTELASALLSAMRRDGFANLSLTLENQGMPFVVSVREWRAQNRDGNRDNNRDPRLERMEYLLHQIGELVDERTGQILWEMNNTRQGAPQQAPHAPQSPQPIAAYPGEEAEPQGFGFGGYRQRSRMRMPSAFSGGGFNGNGGHQD